MMKEKENKKIEEETPRLASPHLKWMGLSMIFSMQGFRIQVLQICSHRTFSRPNRFQFDKTSSVCTFSLHISYSSVSSAYCWSHPQPSSRCHWIYPHCAGSVTSRPASQEPVFSSSPEPGEWPTAGLSSFHRNLQHPLKNAPNKW
jgi:hypothetical protein